jgi:hypothetical protein
MASGNYLAGAVAGAGRKAAGMVSRAADGANHVHATAIQGLFNAHAQQQAHEHFTNSLNQVHSMAAEGTEISHNVNERGQHITKFTKGGSKPAEKGDSHDAAGFRTETRNHYENARQGALTGRKAQSAVTGRGPQHELSGGEKHESLADHPNVFKIEPKAIESEKPENGIKRATANANRKFDSASDKVKRGKSPRTAEDIHRKIVGGGKNPSASIPSLNE